MKAYPDCLPCMLRASLTAARLVGASEEMGWEIVREVAPLLVRSLPGNPPIAASPNVQRTVRRILGVQDPFAEAKSQVNREALGLLPRLREQAAQAEDPLAFLLGLSASGNTADLGAQTHFDLTAAAGESAGGSWGRFDYEPFKALLATARTVLILADNAGEIAFDRLLCEQLTRLGKRVTVAVRGAPTLNDATIVDAREVGLPEVAEVITTGSDHPGVLLSKCSQDFRRRFQDADLVISKGMGNFEGLSGEVGPIFFLLKAKCAPVAQELGVRVGELVLAAGRFDNDGRPRAKLNRRR